MQYEWINNYADMANDYTYICFYDNFNQEIEPDTLPENLTSLKFGSEFNQEIKPNTLSDN